MGVLYKETLRHRKSSFAKALFVLFLLAFIMSTLVNSAQFSSRFDINIELILLADSLLAVYAIRMIYYMFYVSRICYYYRLIDRELIFEKLLGDSRRVVISFDARDIEQLAPLKELRNVKDIDRTYKFLCNHSKNKIYCCIVNQKGKNVRFYFQPSEELINKLNTVIH